MGVSIRIQHRPGGDEGNEEYAYQEVGLDGDARGHLQVVLGVHSLPGVEGHQAQDPRAAGDPRSR